ncbi:GDSL-type esterase/lipase family protein [Spirochaeta isovalerica]|uniref:Lysophospholipase L1-like esterase n=1 Tax=Spirochaeta isovalerica TaxID=150 RepID=A0A841R981_9SPIO|nr:GDSL-type esterase/lipase family protein [Spirochaeta isovalerica]MBB6479921.1 lysophospholipase L1-like esterase [Spirochaeta isovalerica]
MPIEPIMRTDDHHIEKHRRIMDMTGKDNVDSVFIGDSLTRRWEDNPDLWNRFFGSFRPANLGFGGDTLENILWRMENGELEGMNPSVAVILAGTNNIGTHDNVYILDRLADICGSIETRLSDAKLLVVGILPRDRDETGIDYGSRITDINKGLRGLCARKGYAFLDPGSRFLTDEGRPDRNLLPDGLHLDAAGYSILGPLLSAEISKILRGAST